MKKLILVGLLLVSWVYGKSVEQVMNEFEQRGAIKWQEAQAKLQQNEEAMRVAPHCEQGDKNACKRIRDISNKLCDNGSAAICYAAAYSYANGEVQTDTKADLKRAQSYADKVCTMDTTFCAYMPRVFIHKDNNLAISYAKKACEMGELAGCVMAVEFYTSVSSDKVQAKYYTDKLCKGGVSEVCGK